MWFTAPCRSAKLMIFHPWEQSFEMAWMQYNLSGSCAAMGSIACSRVPFSMDSIMFTTCSGCVDRFSSTDAGVKSCYKLTELMRSMPGNSGSDYVLLVLVIRHISCDNSTISRWGWLHGEHRPILMDLTHGSAVEAAGLQPTISSRG